MSAQQVTATGREDKQRGEPTRPVHTRAVAEFVAELDHRQIPAEVRAHAKLDILDTLGCALFGRGLPIAEKLQRALRPGDQSGVASVWGDASWRPSPATAAFVNATLVHSFELDDLHHVAILHPGGPTLAAAAAVAETDGTPTGADLLVAHVAGVEVSCRVGLAVGVPLLMRGWHNNGVLGAIAAAVGAIRVLGGDEDQCQDAIGIAGSLAAGLMAAQYGADIKRGHAGNAAQVGVRAGQLAHAGFTGIKAVFEEPYGGFYSTFADDFAIEETSRDLGTRWETLGVGFKPFSSCGSTHSTVGLLLDLQGEHGFEADDIEAVHVDSSTATAEHVGWHYVPDETITAQMNLAFAGSVALIDHACFVDQFDDDRLADPRILALAEKFEVSGAPDIDAKGRVARHEVRVRLALSDGREITGHTDAARGSAVYPLTLEEVQDKFTDLASRRVGPARAAELVAMVDDLEQLESLQPLWQLLTAE